MPGMMRRLSWSPSVLIVVAVLGALVALVTRVPIVAETVRPAQPSAPAQPSFDEAFTGRTMRVDYFHTSRGPDRIVTLDRVVDDGEWAGSRTILLDELNLGNYRVVVKDAKSGTLLYSRGFGSLFGEWETVPASKQQWRTFRDSLRVPWPRQPVTVAIERRTASEPFAPLWDTTIDPASRFVNRAAPAPAGEVIALRESGPAATKVDLLFIGEGYAPDEREKFLADARRLSDALFRYDPYARRAGDFNVRALLVPAGRTGVHQPRTEDDRRTLLGTAYNIFDSERYALVEDMTRLREAASGVPYDAVVVLMNEEQYGGGGIYRSHSVAAASNEFAEYLLVHEFGHHFAALADEYYTSDVAYETGRTNIPEPWEQNITATTDRARLKWGDLVEATTPLPTPWPKSEFDEAQRAYQAERRKLRETRAPESEMSALFTREQKRETALLGTSPFTGKVGAFEGAGYETKGLYRPEVDCMMFSRNEVGFCRVCRRAIERVIDSYTK